MAADKQTRKTLRTVETLVNRALRLHSLVNDGDRILVGLSGGVDSLVLLRILAMRRKFWADFELAAMHVNIENIPYGVDRDYLQKICEEWDVGLLWHDEKITIEPGKGGKTPCFICSWNRRRILFSQAEKLGFNKLALGHHRDDALETLLMNVIYRGSFSSLPEKLSMFDGKLTLIRPLLYVPKDHIRTYARHYGLRDTVKTCPFANKTSRRNQITALLQQIKTIHPQGLDNLFRAMSNIFDGYLPKIN